MASKKCRTFQEVSLHPAVPLLLTRAILLSSRLFIMINTERLSIIIPNNSYAQAMYNYIQSNKKHFKSCSPEGVFNLTIKDWEARLTNYLQEFESKQALRLILTLKNQTDIVGNITIDNLIWGVFQAGYLGFRLDKKHEGKGYMFEALSAVINSVFEDQRLHRLMANYRPDNKRSEALLTRLGFAREGFAKDYLHLDGAWRDHVMMALVNSK